jgi:actin related protein 2/3 complex, subunit 3
MDTISLPLHLPHINLDEEDVIDETLNFFRANVFFRNFEVRGSSDRTLIYLTLYTHQCLVKCEKIEDRATGKSYAVFVCA